jgi:hypothetical protein
VLCSSKFKNPQITINPRNYLSKYLLNSKNSYQLDGFVTPKHSQIDTPISLFPFFGSVLAFVFLRYKAIFKIKTKAQFRKHRQTKYFVNLDRQNISAYLCVQNTRYQTCPIWIEIKTYTCDHPRNCEPACYQTTDSSI